MNVTVMHVALIGGSCSGKTTVAALAAISLRAAGVRTMIVAEGASAAMANGLDDLGCLEAGAYTRVQAALAVAMHCAAVGADGLVRAAGGGVVIHDRGPLDAIAYAPLGVVDEALAAAGTSVAAVAGGFDLVLSLEAGPFVANEFRYEDIEMIAVRDAAVRGAWRERCWVSEVAFQDTVEAKAALVCDAISSTWAIAVSGRDHTPSCGGELRSHTPAA